MPRRKQSRTVLPALQVSFEDAVKALLRTPPPPAGDPSTRKKKPAKKKRRRN